MKFKTFASLSLLLTTLIWPTLTLAHVTIKPAEVGVGKFQTFVMSVPVEKDIPTTELRLLIPEGLDYVTPTVKPGWQITVSKMGDMKGKVLNSGKELSDEEADKIVEIRWSGNSIPEGFRDEFSFSTQVPTSPTTLDWKVYQTYADGSVVSWDQPPGEKDEEDADIGPLSQTKIIDDLTKNPDLVDSKPANNRPLVYSLLALGLAAISISLNFRKKQ